MNREPPAIGSDEARALGCSCFYDPNPAWPVDRPDPDCRVHGVDWDAVREARREAV